MKLVSAKAKGAGAVYFGVRYAPAELARAERVMKAIGWSGNVFLLAAALREVCGKVGEEGRSPAR
jgi:hypothetical protein